MADRVKLYSTEELRYLAGQLWTHGNYMTHGHAVEDAIKLLSAVDDYWESEHPEVPLKSDHPLHRGDDD